MRSLANLCYCKYAFLNEPCGEEEWLVPARPAPPLRPLCCAQPSHAAYVVATTHQCIEPM